MMREVKERCTMAIRFSEVLGKMKGSDLGPLLALTAQPDIISFAGGLPAPELFPVKEFMARWQLKSDRKTEPVLCSMVRL